MNKKILIICHIFIFLVGKVFCADIYKITDVGISAEMIGYGNIEGFSNTAESVFDNPAGLNRINNWSVSTFSTKIMDEYSYTNIASATKIKNGIIGVGYMQLAIDNIKHTDVAGDGTFVALNTFDYKNELVKIGYATKIEIKNTLINLGGVLNYYSSQNYNVSANGANLDLGGITKLGKNEISIILKNIAWFMDMEYSNGKKEKIAMEFVGGIKVPCKNIHFLGQVKKIENKQNLLKNLGLEYLLNIQNIKLAIRGGYKEFYELSEIDNNWMLGASIEVKEIKISYAYEKSEDVNNKLTQYYSLSFRC